MKHTILQRRNAIKLLAGGALLVGLFAQHAVVPAESATRLPPPEKSDARIDAESQTAIFAGGCFWGVQGVFQHVKGIQRAVSGYSGGKASDAYYRAVSSGQTQHAESVEITYDPSQISYGELLQIFFSVVHDPTQLNRQGPDIGPQYRSAIFATSPAQLELAQAYVSQLDHAKLLGGPIVTKLEATPSFYPAELYHQDYMFNNPNQPYIAFHDQPKLENLKRLFPEKYRDEPVLYGKRR